MKEYRENFQDYIKDLGERTPDPGGGSCAALGFCLGVSLILMAANYSREEISKDREELERLRSDIFPFIDEDGKIFDAVIKEKEPEAKKILIDKAQAMICRLGDHCHLVLELAKKMEKGIKRSLASDFYLGLKFIETALYASILNLNSNQIMFKVDNRDNIGRLEKYKQEFSLCLK